MSATVKVGAVTSVMPSVCDVPESDAAVRTGVPPLGAVVSSVMVSAAVVELLPKESLNCAEICLLPSAPRSPAVTVRLTLPAVMSAAVTVCVTGCASAATIRNASALVYSTVASRDRLSSSCFSPSAHGSFSTMYLSTAETSPHAASSAFENWH